LNDDRKDHVLFFSQTRKEGILSFPGESFEDFKIRANDIKLHKQMFLKENQCKGFFLHPFSFKGLEVSTYVLLKKGAKDLHPWEAAATWTVDYKNTALSYIQYKDSQRVSIDELLNHEIVHEMRCGFKEKIFEEFLAYKTSRSIYRRLFGPVFISSCESVVFLSAFFALLGSYIVFDNDVFIWMMIFLLAFLLLRLGILQWIFIRCLNRLAKVFGNHDPLAIAISLTDQEIIQIASKKQSDILHYFAAKKTPRFQQILDTFT